MLFLTTLALIASVAFAAPQVQVHHLEKLADSAIAEIAKAPLGTVEGITLKGLSSLRRAKCELKNGEFVCTAVADNAVVRTHEGEDLKATVKIPISIILSGDKFEQFVVGEANVEIVEEEDDGLFGLGKKIKQAASKAGKAVGKVAKSAAQIAGQAAKAALTEKAQGLAGKAIGVVAGAVLGK